jgi:hypothetical protein
MIKNLLSAGGLFVEMLGVYVLLVKAGARQDALDWPARIRGFGLWLFEQKREYSSLTGLICLVFGGLLQIAIFFP